MFTSSFTSFLLLVRGFNLVLHHSAYTYIRTRGYPDCFDYKNRNILELENVHFSFTSFLLLFAFCLEQGDVGNEWWPELKLTTIILPQGKAGCRPMCALFDMGIPCRKMPWWQCNVPATRSLASRSHLVCGWVGCLVWWVKEVKWARTQREQRDKPHMLVVG